MSKPKRNQAENMNQEQNRDLFQTPDYGTDLIVPYLHGVVWECAAGQGYMRNRLAYHGFDVLATDIQDGFNFLLDSQHNPFDVIATNPPFSLKRKFYMKCKSYGKPFALLIPADFCNWILRAMAEDGAQWLMPTRRIDYVTPTGRSGKESNSQFHSGWLAVGLNLPESITIVELSLETKQAAQVAGSLD